MKTTSLPFPVILVALAACTTLQNAAAQLSWGATGGGGSGTWNTSNLNWYNGTTTVTWPSSGTDNDAVFAGTAATVTVSSVAANDLTFKTTGYQLSSGTLTLNGTTPTITVDPGLQATINSAIAGSAGLYKAGSGTLLLSSSSSSWTGGTFIRAGRIALSTADNRLPTNSTVTLGGASTAGTLQLGSSTTARNQTLGGLLATGLGGNVVGSASGTTANLTLNIASGNNDFGGSGVIGGSTAGERNITLNKTGAGTLTLSGVNSYTNRTTNSAGTLLSTRNAALSSTAAVVVTNTGSTLAVRYGAPANYSQAEIGTLLGKTTFGSTNTAFGIDTSDASGTYSNNLNMAAGLTKLGANTLTVIGTNGYTGATTVSAGTLNLNTTGGSAAASTTSVSVVSGAVLLISQSDQVNNAAAVSLSGGTIAKGTGVINENFGALTLGATSFLDFGATGTGNFTFAGFTPAGFKLTFQNFNLGNSLTVTTGTYSASDFDFGGFGTSFSAVPSGGFTITAIPEPSSVIAGLGLLGLCAWPLRRHLARCKAAGML